MSGVATTVGSYSVFAVLRWVFGGTAGCHCPVMIEVRVQWMHEQSPWKHWTLQQMERKRKRRLPGKELHGEIAQWIGNKYFIDLWCDIWPPGAKFRLLLVRLWSLSKWTNDISQIWQWHWRYSKKKNIVWMCQCSSCYVDMKQKAWFVKQKSKWMNEAASGHILEGVHIWSPVHSNLSAWRHDLLRSQKEFSVFMYQVRLWMKSLLSHESDRQASKQETWKREEKQKNN